MKAHMPRSYDSLPTREQEKIKEIMNNVCTQTVHERLDTELAYVQRLWIKMSCIILHEMYGLGEDRLTGYIAGFKRKYADIARLGSNEEVREYLDRDIRKIFRRGEYPDEWVEKL